jgi:hypothetical protein
MQPSAAGPAAVTLRDLADQTFESTVIGSLPGDPQRDNQPRAVPGAAYTEVLPTPVGAPRLLAWSDELGEELGLARPVGGSLG